MGCLAGCFARVEPRRQARWDALDAMREIRTFVVSGLGDTAGAVLVLDESGQEKADEHTAGVKR